MHCQTSCLVRPTKSTFDNWIHRMQTLVLAIKVDTRFEKSRNDCTTSNQNPISNVWNSTISFVQAPDINHFLRRLITIMRLPTSFPRFSNHNFAETSKQRATFRFQIWASQIVSFFATHLVITIILECSDPVRLRLISETGSDISWPIVYSPALLKTLKNEFFSLTDPVQAFRCNKIQSLVSCFISRTQTRARLR